MKVKFVRSTSVFGTLYLPGQVAPIPNRIAVSLVVRGLAEPEGENVDPRVTGEPLPPDDPAEGAEVPENYEGPVIEVPDAPDPDSQDSATGGDPAPDPGDSAGETDMVQNEPPAPSGIEFDDGKTA